MPPISITYMRLTIRKMIGSSRFISHYTSLRIMSFRLAGLYLLLLLCSRSDLFFGKVKVVVRQHTKQRGGYAISRLRGHLQELLTLGSVVFWHLPTPNDKRGTAPCKASLTLA
jgi:hypothetical protein